MAAINIAKDKQISQDYRFTYGDSLGALVTNLYNLGFTHKDGSTDYWAWGKFVAISGVEIAETATYTFVSRGSGKADLDYSQKFLIGLGVGTAFGIIKEYLYSNLITQHITPNSAKNIANEWCKSYCESNDINQNELLSKALFQSECGTYQFGNVLKGFLGGVIKLSLSISSIVKGNFLVPLYSACALGAHYTISIKTNELFEKVKESAVDIKNSPFKFTNATEGVEEIYQKIDNLQETEIQMGHYKVLSSLLVSAHENIAGSKRGYVHAQMLANGKIMSANAQSDHAIKMSESTFLVKWTGENFFRWIDIIHRAEMVNRYLKEIVNHRLDNSDNELDYADSALTGNVDETFDKAEL